MHLFPFLGISRKFLSERRFVIIKPVTKDELRALIDAGVIKQRGSIFVNALGVPTAYYRTKGSAARVYLQDQYADQAKLLYEAKNSSRKE